MSSRLFAASLSALLAVTFSITSHAADSASNLLNLHQLRLAAQKSLGDFYMYNGMEGDQRYARMINEAVASADGHLAAISDLPGDGSRALRSQLDQHWKGYQIDLTNLINALKNQGYTDLQPVADLAARNQQLIALSQELYSKIQQEGSYNVPAMTQQSRDQSVLMQTIAVDYASRSASVGATFMGGGENRPIEELVGEFATRLDTLEKAPQNTDQIKQTLSSVSTKWRYIEKSLLNYNENTVPFLINKYSDSIIEGLEEASAQYSATQL
ncbi:MULTISPECIES: hypothetical protein [unclassified Pseudomonas]|uniref:hypothetical protein n=1 Tax=unclassified Pseudomonas TaxID=196821 RepID=UPI0024486F90|nr:hypothetical protein [Pseudomonas sp. GD03944]MDH1261561.1 hypothetical protein [Pseudomonas sp. GD03944]